MRLIEASRCEFFDRTEFLSLVEVFCVLPGVGEGRFVEGGAGVGHGVSIDSTFVGRMHTRNIVQRKEFMLGPVPVPRVKNIRSNAPRVSLISLALACVSRSR
jgi:hypothetical protein